MTASEAAGRLRELELEDVTASEARELSLHTHIWLRGAGPQLPRVVVRKEQLMTHI